MPEILDHYRAEPGTDASVDPGVYRVVGTGEDAVTLLQVAREGRRVHEGEVIQIPRAHLDALVPANDPDTGLGRLRQVPQQLAGHPLVSTAALLAVAVGVYLRVVEGVGAGALAVGAGLIALWLLVK